MLAFEKRWANAVLAGFAPSRGPGLAPRRGEVRYAETALAMMRASNTFASWGMRVSLWLAFFSPLWATGRLATLASMDPEGRAALLDRLLCHRTYMIRELTLLLKFAACMAMFRVPSIRERSGYDRRADWAPEDVERSGERVRVRLPLLAEPGAEVA